MLSKLLLILTVIAVASGTAVDIDLRSGWPGTPITSEVLYVLLCMCDCSEYLATNFDDGSHWAFASRVGDMANVEVDVLILLW